jgi:hypothetical protein
LFAGKKMWVKKKVVGREEKKKQKGCGLARGQTHRSEKRRWRDREMERVDR